MQDIHPGMRRSMSIDMAKSMGGKPMGLPQHFPPSGVPMQQHNIMGQPFIELRHRAPDSRLRLPFGSSGMQGNNMDPDLQPQRPPGFMGGPEFRLPPNQGPRMMESMGDQQMSQGQLSSNIETLHQHQQAQMQGGAMPRQAQLMRSMSHPALNETQGMSAPSMMIPGSSAGKSDGQGGVSMANNNDGVDDKLDTVESAVKDLEDVEVKDLVDADLDNLNLDPEEDGKDLDLETNDLHLDDFLTSGKFDIIAYTDPDLDDVKKDLFNEELDLNDPMEDHSDACDFQKALSEKRSSSCGGAASSFSNLTSGMGKSEGMAEKTDDVKQEVSCRQSSASSLPSEYKIKMEDKDNLSQTSNERTEQQADGNTNKQSGVLSASTPVLSSLLIKQQPEDSTCDNQGSGNSMTQPNQDTQNNSGLSMGSQTMDPTNRGEEEGEASMSTFEMDQSGLTPAQQALLVQTLGQVGPGGHRPLLLEEQPLLLQDLLDQERQEQQQQRQMQAMIRQRSSSDSFFPNIGNLMFFIQAKCFYSSSNKLFTFTFCMRNK